uniref:Enoyl reductase (ER) domain-containing protein n=1 Tax=Glossina brevipalpis TaxID=37001 RepID=A0A1A9WJG7_9MUSC
MDFAFHYKVENRKSIFLLPLICPLQRSANILTIKRYLCKSAVPHFCSPLKTNMNTIQDCKVELHNSATNSNNEIIKIEKACEIKKVCVEIPKFSAYDVLVRTCEVAITGSDIHVYEHGSANSANISLGHDATGIIEATGNCIHNLRRGDRVVMESCLSCGICEFCKRGVYNVCKNIIYNGFLIKYQVHPADLCYKLPDTLEMSEATLTNTLAQGCQAVFKAHITPTTNVLIMGSSAIAVASAFCAQAIGAKHVAFACTMPTTLVSIHEDFDFDYICYDAHGDYCEILEGIFCTFHDWPDVVINCSINERTMNIAVMCLRPCGTCVLTECESEGACFNALDVLMKNIRIIPSFRSKNMFATAIHLINSGRAPMNKMIAAKYQWSNIEQAFAAAQSESNCGYKKVIIQCAED